MPEHELTAICKYQCKDDWKYKRGGNDIEMLAINNLMQIYYRQKGGEIFEDWQVDRPHRIALGVIDECVETQSMVAAIGIAFGGKKSGV